MCVVRHSPKPCLSNLQWDQTGGSCGRIRRLGAVLASGRLVDRQPAKAVGAGVVRLPDTWTEKLATGIYFLKWEPTSDGTEPRPPLRLAVIR
jgi:hypothetical protein